MSARIPGGERLERIRERENVEWGWSRFQRVQWFDFHLNHMRMVVRGSIILWAVAVYSTYFCNTLILRLSMKTNTHKHHHINMIWQRLAGWLCYVFLTFIDTRSCLLVSIWKTPLLTSCQWAWPWASLWAEATSAVSWLEGVKRLGNSPVSHVDFLAIVEEALCQDDGVKRWEWFGLLSHHMEESCQVISSRLCVGQKYIFVG